MPADILRDREEAVSDSPPPASPSGGGFADLASRISQAEMERKAAIDEVIALRGAGLMSRVEAWMRLHPGASEADATAALAAIDGEGKA